MLLLFNCLLLLQLLLLGFLIPPYYYNYTITSKHAIFTITITIIYYYDPMSGVTDIAVDETKGTFIYLAFSINTKY